MDQEQEAAPAAELGPKRKKNDQGPGWKLHVDWFETGVSVATSLPAFKGIPGPVLPARLKTRGTNPSALQAFNLFFSDSMISRVITCTNKYIAMCSQKTRPETYVGRTWPPNWNRDW